MIFTEMAARTGALCFGTLALFNSADAGLKAIAPPPISGSGVIAANGSVEPGAQYIVEWSIVKRTSCPGRASRHWRGADNFTMTEPETETALPTSRAVTNYQIPTAIPALAPPGELLLYIVGHYKCPSEPETRFTLGPVTMTVGE